jgi:hypothetical protein
MFDLAVHTQVLTLSKRGISTMLAWPDTGDGWQVLGQYTSLEDLAIWRPEQTCNFSASWWQALSSLRSLTALRLGVQLVDFSPLPHLAQLTLLHLSVPKSQPVDHAAALTHLTAVIELGIYAASYPINLSMHSSIACAIGAMSSLQRLDLPEVAPGAWTDALTRLKGLTQLTARYLGCQDAACRLHMPSLKVLYTCQITARQLALITAPSLTHLLRLEPSYTPNIRLLCESGQPDIVKVSASGLLRHCNRVHVRPLDPSGGIWAQAESHATLNALCQSWRPTADVMGSDAASRVWDLEVECMEFGQAEAALVPAGITHLRLRWVPMEAPVSLPGLSIDIGRVSLLFALLLVSPSAFNTAANSCQLQTSTKEASPYTGAPANLHPDCSVPPALHFLLQCVHAFPRQLGTSRQPVQLA